MSTQQRPARSREYTPSCSVVGLIHVRKSHEMRQLPKVQQRGQDARAGLQLARGRCPSEQAEHTCKCRLADRRPNRHQRVTICRATSRTHHNITYTPSIATVGAPYERRHGANYSANPGIPHSKLLQGRVYEGIEAYVRSSKKSSSRARLPFALRLNRLHVHYIVQCE